MLMLPVKHFLLVHQPKLSTKTYDQRFLLYAILLII